MINIKTCRSPVVFSETDVMRRKSGPVLVEKRKQPHTFMITRGSLISTENR